MKLKYKQKDNEEDIINIEHEDSPVKVEIEENIDNIDDIIWLEKRSLHPTGRMRHKLKQKTNNDNDNIDNSVIYLSKKKLHSTERIRSKLKQKANNDNVSDDNNLIY